jgi:hypothetical protein
MSNPGPNIVDAGIQRGQAVLSVAVTPASAASGISSQNFTVSGLAVGDFVTVNQTKSAGSGVCVAGAYVSAANTLTVIYDNQSGGSATPAADTYLVSVSRSYPVQTDFGVNKFNNVGPVAGTNP